MTQNNTNETIHLKHLLERLIVGLYAVLLFLLLILQTLWAGVLNSLHAIRSLGKTVQRTVRVLEPWTLFLAVTGTLLALSAFVFEMDDRQSERKFRAWSIVQNYENLVLRRQLDSMRRVHLSGDLKEAIEFLNREFQGFICDDATTEPVEWTSVRWYSTILTGNSNRDCIFPRKDRVLLSGLNARGAHVPGIDLSGAILEKSNFSHARLSGGNLSNAMLFGTSFEQGEYIGTDFTDACLLAVDFIKSVLIDADFSGAYLIGSDFSEAMLHNAIFEGAYIEDSFFVNTIRNIARRETGNDDREPTEIFGVLKGMFDEILVRFKLEISVFKEKCGMLLSPTRIKHPSLSFAGLFVDFLDSEAASELGGVNFTSAKELREEQFDKAICLGVPEEYENGFEDFPPEGLPESICQ